MYSTNNNTIEASYYFEGKERRIKNMFGHDSLRIPEEMIDFFILSIEAGFPDWNTFERMKEFREERNRFVNRVFDAMAHDLIESLEKDEKFDERIADAVQRKR